MVEISDPSVKSKRSRIGLSGLTPGLGVQGHLAIISRAVLLLRVAAGATSALFESVGVRREELEFWRGSAGINRGLWDEEPDSLTDLWSDVADSLTELEVFIADDADKKTYFNLGARYGRASVLLGSCERVAMWSIAAT